MKQNLIVAVLLVVASALGCDMWYGISRYGSLSQYPKPDCVEAVIRRAQESNGST
jgi:hypothetical protein